ncbi:MAG: hypothetical protein NY202_04210 [Mollicutes bacterium UO1]
MAGSTSKDKKPRQGVKLMKGGERIEVYCETGEFQFGIVSSEKMDDYLKWVKEVEKIVPRGKSDLPTSPSEPTSYTSPSESQVPQDPTRPADSQSKEELVSRFIGCHDLEVAKKCIKEYYQGNQLEVEKNPDFAHWVKVKKTRTG